MHRAPPARVAGGAPFTFDKEVTMTKSMRIFSAAVCLFAVLFLCIGYAAVTGTLVITGNVSYKEQPYNGVLITNVQYQTSNGLELKEYSFSKPTNLQMTANVAGSNASITLEVTVYNQSDSTQWFQGVAAFPDYGSNSLIGTTLGITISTKDTYGSNATLFDEEDWVPPQTSRSFYVTYHFGSMAIGTVSTMIKFDFGMRIASVQDGVLGILNNPTTYSYLVNAFEEAYQESGTTVLGNVGDDKKIFDNLFGSNLTVTVDGVEKPVTIMIARENVDGNETSGDDYSANSALQGCEYTIYVTVDDLSSPGGQATVYAVTYTHREGGWYQIGELYEGTTTVVDYDKTDADYDGAFDVSQWRAVKKNYTILDSLTYPVGDPQAQKEYQCFTIEDLMTAPINDFRNKTDQIKGKLADACKVVYSYTNVNGQYRESINTATQNKPGYAALKSAFDELKPYLQINNGAADVRLLDSITNLTRAELIWRLEALETAYKYYQEVN